MEATSREEETVQFVASCLKLGTTSAKFHVYHYVEGDFYQLPLLGNDLSLKVTKDAYTPLLKLLKAPKILITIDQNLVTIVEPYRDLKPLPRYELDYKNNSLFIRTSFSIAYITYTNLCTLPYFFNHVLSKFDNQNESHKIKPINLITIYKQKCGCCADIIFLDEIKCPVCSRYIHSGPNHVLGYWLLHQSNLPDPPLFTPKLEGELITIYEGNNKILSQKMEDIIKDLMGTERFLIKKV